MTALVNRFIVQVLTRITNLNDINNCMQYSQIKLRHIPRLRRFNGKVIGALDYNQIICPSSVFVLRSKWRNIIKSKVRVRWV